MEWFLVDQLLLSLKAYESPYRALSDTYPSIFHSNTADTKYSRRRMEQTYHLTSVQRKYRKFDRPTHRASLLPRMNAFI